MTGLALWPVATLVSIFSVNVALALYAFTAIFYVVLPIPRENHGATVRSRE